MYAVSGTGIPAGTTFTYGGSSAGTLSQAATATSAGVTFTFTKPLGVGPWQVLGDTPAGVSLYAVDGDWMKRKNDVPIKYFDLVPGDKVDDDMQMKEKTIPAGARTNGEISLFVAISSLIKGVEVERDKVDAGTYASLGKLANE